MTDRELMQQALDALEGYARNCRCEGGGAPCDSAEALRARLAQPKEPALTGIDCSCGRRWRVENNTLTVSAQPEQEPVATLFGSLPVYDVPPPEQEPVAWMVITMGEVTSMQPHMIAAEMLDGTHQLYTAPPQREWQGLTDEEMFSLWVKCPAETEDRFAFARAIEAKLKEKNGY